MWRTNELLEAMAQGVGERDSELIAEQAVYGLDALSEIELHPVLAAGIEGAGFGVRYELVYPGQSRGSPGKRPIRRDRQRCDLVVVPTPDDEVMDDVQELTEQDKGLGTLFETVQQPEAPAAGIPPSEAFWLEVKSVSQYTYRDGVPVPNRSYASELVKGPGADLRKLAADPKIEYGGVALALFAEDRAIAEHDLAATAHAWLDAGLSFASPRTEYADITNRAGNGVCALMLAEVRSMG